MRSLFAFLICIAFVTTSISPIEAKVIRVPEDHPTIFGAAISADGGDTILVGPGVYEEDIYIIPRLGRKFGALNLQGAGPKETTIIGSIDIKTGGEEVKQPFKIEGFRIEGTISVGGISITISHNFITNSPPNRWDRVSGGIYVGCYIPHKIRIEENIIKGTSSGIRCEGDDGINGKIADVLIANNIIANNEVSVSCDKASPKIRENRIVGNKWGVNIYESIPDLGTRQDPGRNTIYKNTEYDIRNSTDEIISAEYNYWGDVGGPEKGGVILLNRGNGWIDYKPWLHRNEAAYSVQPQRKLTSTWGQIKAR